jgi:hypothetical protein
MAPNAGNMATNPTPVKPLTIQDIKIGQKGKIEMLRGQNQYPDDTATGDKDGTFEFSMGRRDFNLLNQIFNADTVTAGGISVYPNFSTAILATITIVPPATGTFKTDLGVTMAATNKELQCSGLVVPNAGQYGVTSAGVYTFNSTDVTAGGNVLISYSYSQTTIGTTFQVNNQVQGFGPAFEAFIVDTYQPVLSSTVPVYSTIALYAAKISDVEIDNKRSGYGMIALKGSYYVGAGNRVIDFFSNV